MFRDCRSCRVLGHTGDGALARAPRRLSCGGPVFRSGCTVLRRNASEAAIHPAWPAMDDLDTTRPIFSRSDAPALACGRVPARALREIAPDSALAESVIASGITADR